MNGKKAASPVIENVIFIILNIMFFAMMIVFVVRAGSGASVLEQAYAKQAALIIDNAKPDMSIFIDAEDALKIAKKNGVKAESIARVDENANKIIIKLSQRGAFSYQFFNDADVSVAVQGIYFKIDVKEKAQNA